MGAEVGMLGLNAHAEASSQAALIRKLHAARDGEIVEMDRRQISDLIVIPPFIRQGTVCAYCQRAVRGDVCANCGARP